MPDLLPPSVHRYFASGLSALAIAKLWPEADATIFGATGACWTLGGLAYFGYLRRLRRDIEQLERDRRHGVARSDLMPVSADQAAPPARFQPRARLP